jgi:hypothetical protein
VEGILAVPQEPEVARAVWGWYDARRISAGILAARIGSGAGSPVSGTAGSVREPRNGAPLRLRRAGRATPASVFLVLALGLSCRAGGGEPAREPRQAAGKRAPAGISDSPATAGVAETTEARPQRAVYRRLVALPRGWNMPFCPAGGSPWSPDGRLLAVGNGLELAVFDVTRPQEAPRVIFTAAPPTNMTISWAPDGRWIACHAKTYWHPSDRGGVRIADLLWAIPVAGGRPVLVDEVDAWPFLWASDGYIYGWKGRVVQKYAAPDPWRAGNPATRSTSPRLVYTLGQGTVLFTPGDPPRTVRVPPTIGNVFEGDPLPDGGGFLIKRFYCGRGQPPYGAVVSVGLEPLSSLDGPAREDSSGTDLELFAPTSVSADGRYVLGFYEVDRDEDVAKAVVYVVDSGGRWRLPVEGAVYSTRPECSPRGNFLALEVLRGGLEVGVLEIVR